MTFPFPLLSNVREKKLILASVCSSWAVSGHQHIPFKQNPFLKGSLGNTPRLRGGESQEHQGVVSEGQPRCQQREGSVCFSKQCHGCKAL